MGHFSFEVFVSKLFIEKMVLVLTLTNFYRNGTINFVFTFNLNLLIRNGIFSTFQRDLWNERNKFKKYINDSSLLFGHIIYLVIYRHFLIAIPNHKIWWASKLQITSNLIAFWEHENHWHIILPSSVSSRVTLRFFLYRYTVLKVTRYLITFQHT